MSPAEPREIDWSTAEVEGGVLNVALSGADSKRWRRRFDSVLALLERGGGEWGEVRVTKRGLSVSGLRPGTESDLRHFLESIVLETNSELAPDGAHGGADVEDEDPEQRAEVRMRATFRSFAAQADE